MAAAVLSRFADAIVANSYAGRSYHQRCGYKDRHFDVIPNGIDTERFRPSVHARRATRQALGMGDSDVLIGVAARLDPMKGHDVLFRALPSVIMAAPHVRIVLVGDGAPSYARQLQSLADDQGIASSVIWAGEASDMSAVYPAFDVACSPSVGEGFSNSVGEAMACGVPCVVTDVGDSARVVGDTGRVVPANDHGALAEALSEMAMRSPEQRTAAGMRARDRVKTHFAVRTMLDHTSSLYRQLIAVTPSAGGEQR
jgi:glycosyltransferase involved in cell wall biosynthesis